MITKAQHPWIVVVGSHNVAPSNRTIILTERSGHPCASSGIRAKLIGAPTLASVLVYPNNFTTSEEGFFANLSTQLVSQELLQRSFLRHYCEGINNTGKMNLW
ncbi:uncharacterized protein LOC121054392 [Oryza brachyantha]|uniref:uncharacterized protein LOC121054392 n=1 Tax=Oryza brachyantha TaxID=4533 RepID=UPI001ADA642E|nr:uncharacterized protein LOC121054392 [Oryza brachyantha]XP_040379732.1 uncharacterized protein LOC121054392 [Oryza brachyantha]XP_040379733.1 uncharacterized protein LOC121054392 [Oryza brachyantha]XP_040379734.1 uncharacterized protein LOC121054392 [Oryza brachyantha]